jgi:molybdenum cofactor cytidylyltransferase
MTTAAAILAAGSGSRFAGEPRSHGKLRVPLQGRPLVQWAVDHALAAGLDEVIVVTGATAIEDLLPASARVVHNPDWSGGIATSLACAVAAARDHGHDALVVGLGDQPFVPPEAWRLVAASDTTAIAVASYDGRRRNPVRLDRSVWDLLPTTGDEGARRLMSERPELVTEVACAGDPADIDTQEDLTRWS